MKYVVEHVIHTMVNVQRGCNAVTVTGTKDYKLWDMLILIQLYPSSSIQCCLFVDALDVATLSFAAIQIMTNVCLRLTSYYEVQ